VVVLSDVLQHAFGLPGSMVPSATVAPAMSQDALWAQWGTLLSAVELFEGSQIMQLSVTSGSWLRYSWAPTRQPETQVPLLQ
jgi:hypothetical protein